MSRYDRDDEDCICPIELPHCSQCGCDIASCGAYSQDMTSGRFICADCEPIEPRGDIFAPAPRPHEWHEAHPQDNSDTARASAPRSEPLTPQAETR